MTSVGAFVHPIRIYWEDTDAGGIVFYANYLKFFERARTEWLRSLGIGQRALKDDTGGMFVVTETSLRYLRPARLDDELWVTANLSQIGRASLTIRQKALLKSEQTGDGHGAPSKDSCHDSQLLCEGSIRIGWVKAATLQPMRIPADVLAALRPA